MDQWWNQYASPQDYQDILRYNPPWYTLPEQFPPPLAGRDGYFPYYEGLLFVEYLYERGNWAEVNKAYENLPLSSEQILHPDKYIQGEQPIEVAPFALESALGEGWREISGTVWENGGRISSSAMAQITRRRSMSLPPSRHPRAGVETPTRSFITTGMIVLPWLRIGSGIPQPMQASFTMLYPSI